MFTTDRLQLQTVLETVLGTDKVYFQPPASVKMVYPCIVYSWDETDTKFADNTPYHQCKGYQVTVIDRNPDTDIPDRVSRLPLCSLSDTFVTDNLNHYVFRLYA